MTRDDPSLYFDTFLDRWPAALTAHSMATHIYRMDRADTLAFLSQHKTTRALIGARQRMPFSSAMMQWLEDCVSKFPQGMFARLNACSFVRRDREPKRLDTAEQVVKLLMHPGERAASLAFRTFRARRDVCLCLREWRHMPPWTEFRIFVQKRRVIGVSQYHHRLAFQEIEERLTHIQATLKEAVTTLLADLHLDSVVVDLLITEDGWQLIELNPFSPDTGAVLFTWEGGGDFDGTLRYRTASGTVVHQTMY